MIKFLFFSTSLIYTLFGFSQTELFIPTVLSGEDIDLTMQEGVTEFYPSILTNTMGANGNLLGPTLILNQGDFVNITVNNTLLDTTTMHWHGLHVSPVNDGGPHSLILPGETWNPQFTVLDKAGTFWYHPHLHMKTDKHVSKGIAGLILIRDSEEATLNLPMTYGVDEFPIIFQSKGFDADGQIEVHTNLDTAAMVNGTINATVDFPAQIVRLRVLNGASQRLLEFGLSDDKSFRLIGTDGGLLTAPVSLTRFTLAPGQRADILIDLTDDFGSNLQIINYASEIPNGYYGGVQPGLPAFATASLIGYVDNPLNGADYEILNIDVVAPTDSPITEIPAVLASYDPIPETESDFTREIRFSSAGGMDLNGPFQINAEEFDHDVINFSVPFNNTEIWELVNQTPIGHPFHVHDVQFFILDMDGVEPPVEMRGLHDVILVRPGMGRVRIIAIYNDFSDNVIPYMYHCHMLVHEDRGMMGQFIVENDMNIIDENSISNKLNIYPNPSINGAFTIILSSEIHADSYKVMSMDGRLITSEKVVSNSFSIDLEKETEGTYLLIIQTDSGIISRRVVRGV